MPCDQEYTFLRNETQFYGNIEKIENRLFPIRIYDTQISILMRYKSTCNW